MTPLLKGKSNSINWTHECNSSFSTLKIALTKAPILNIIDTSKGNVVLCTNASEWAIGVVLMQNKHVIAYESCKLNYSQLNYFVHEKELVAIIHALKIWRRCLLGIKFNIEIDHQSLKYLLAPSKLKTKSMDWINATVWFQY